MKYVAVARNTQTNDADLRSLQNLLRKLLQGQNNHLTRRHFNQHFLWGKVCPCTKSFSSLQIFQSGVSTSFDRLSMFFWFVCFPCLPDRAQQHPVVFQVSTKVHRAPKTGRFTKKENLRKYCVLWQDLETVYGMRANCHLGTGGLWFVRQLLTIDNGEHNHTLCCKPPCALKHHYTVDCHTFGTAVINCRKYAQCSCIDLHWGHGDYCWQCRKNRYSWSRSRFCI